MPSTPDDFVNGGKTPADFVICEHCGRKLHRKRPPTWLKAFTCPPRQYVDLGYETCDCEGAVAKRIAELEGKWQAMAVEAQGDADLMLRAAALRSGIPERYVLAEMDDAAKFLELVKTVDDGRGLFLTGETGAGKTHAACAVAQHFLRRGKTVRFADPEQIEREVKASWRREVNDDEHSVISRYVTADLVIIDDLGAEAMTSTTMKALRAIISGREANGRVTIFTSNLTREQLAQRVADGTDEVMADRMASRIKGMTRMFCFDGPDRRISR